MKKEIKQSFIIALWAVAIIWIVFLVLGPIFGIFSESELNDFGIIPRKQIGLKGIIFSPFLHSNWGHLIGNSISLFILTFLVAHFYKKLWIPTTIFSVLVGGLSVWLFARSANHIGASGVIFSFIGFLLFSGIFRKSPKSIIIGIVVLLLYGGTLIYGIIPSRPGVSWEGHLFGAIAGIIAAYMYRNKYKQGETVIK